MNASGDSRVVRVYSKPKFDGGPKKKRKSIVRYIFIFLFVGFLGGGTYLVFEYYTLLEIYLQGSKYETVLQEQSLFEYEMASQSRLDKDKFSDLELKYKNLIETYPTNPVLFYSFGKLYFETFDFHIQKSDIYLADTFLLRYTRRSKKVQLNHKKLWESSLIYFRKAFALGLPEGESLDTISRIFYLRLFSKVDEIKLLNNKYAEKIYSNQHMTNKPRRFKNISYVFSYSQEPEWESLEEDYSEYFLNYFKVIYYLNIGNKPFGFSLLRKMMRSEPASKEDTQCRNNVMYLIGYLTRSGKSKNSRKQLKSYAGIDLNDFLKRHPWFFEEYLRLLKFFGERKKMLDLQNVFSNIKPEL